MAIEDFTTYTEVDPGNDVTVAANSLTMLLFDTRNTTSYVAKDFGVNYFAGDFIYRFRLQCNVMGNLVILQPFMLTNTLTDTKTIADAGGDAQGVYVYASEAVYYMRIRIIEAGNINDTGGTSYPIVQGTNYYITVERDDDGGANNTGRITCRVYTGNYYNSPGAVEVHTFTADCAAGEQNDFRYLNALVSHNTGATYQASGVIASSERIPSGGMPQKFHHYNKNAGDP